jgi:hypothetical protein
MIVASVGHIICMERERRILLNLREASNPAKIQTVYFPHLNMMFYYYAMC